MKDEEMALSDDDDEDEDFETCNSNSTMLVLEILVHCHQSLPASLTIVFRVVSERVLWCIASTIIFPKCCSNPHTSMSQRLQNHPQNNRPNFFPRREANLKRNWNKVSYIYKSLPFCSTFSLEFYVTFDISESSKYIAIPITCRPYRSFLCVISPFSIVKLCHNIMALNCRISSSSIFIIHSTSDLYIILHHDPINGIIFFAA